MRGNVAQTNVEEEEGATESQRWFGLANPLWSHLFHPSASSIIQCYATCWGRSRVCSCYA
jgi:hypothetical protein